MHHDAAMFVGGLRALLRQSMHPVAMTAVAQHSDYRTDPWGRLQRTGTCLATTIYGSAQHARPAVNRVRRIHARISGSGLGGLTYSADDPHLLGRAHVAETESFLRCHQRHGEHPLDNADCDGYVSDTSRVAAAVGEPDPPRTRVDPDAALTVRAIRWAMHARPQPGREGHAEVSAAPSREIEQR